MAANAQKVLVEDAVSPREEGFLNHIVSGLSRAGAAKASGYEFKNMAKGASAILSRPVVKARLAVLVAAAARRARISQDDILEGFKTAISDARLTNDPQAQIAGWREIAKMLGFYAPEVKRIEISHTEEKARAELASLSEQDLLDMVIDEGGYRGRVQITR